MVTKFGNNVYDDLAYAMRAVLIYIEEGCTETILDNIIEPIISEL